MEREECSGKQLVQEEWARLDNVPRPLSLTGRVLEQEEGLDPQLDVNT